MFMPGPIPDNKDAPEENKPWLTDMLNDLGDGVASLLKNLIFAVIRYQFLF